MVTLVNCVAPHHADDPGIPPPGLLSLAASVREAGFAVRLADLAAAGPGGLPTPAAFPQWLGETGPVTGFSSMSNMLPYALEAARQLKAAAPQTTVVFGGCGAQASVHDLLARFPFIDVIVQGEAEGTFPRFLRHLEHPAAWREIPGLAFRDEGGIRINPPPPPLRDLDGLPHPAYDLVDFAAYRSYVGVLTSRGCPFACSYCEAGAFQRRWAARSVARVFEEIRYLHGLRPVARLGLVDDTFTVRQGRAAEFCREYLKGGWDFLWGALARVDGIDAPLMKLMFEAGCRNIYFGVESGSDRTLRAIRKGVTRAQASEVIPRAREFIPQVYASFMWGFPFEEMSDLEETLFLAAYLRTFGVEVQLHLWSPMPRSPLFKRYESQLVYDPAVQSNIVPGDVAGYRSLIESSPAIFAPFYHVPHADFEQKKQMIAAMGFDG
jgi:radical SAM superfamily enzyme YgiQ (UPF0313 family)